jgi:small subunit ribosomal protein S20
MANTHSAQKQVKKNIKRRKINLARLSAIKTAIKKVMLAIEKGEASVATLMREAESQLARAKGKKTLNAKTASRKISRLAKKAAQVTK